MSQLEALGEQRRDGITIRAEEADAATIASVFAANGVVVVSDFADPEMARRAAAEVDAVVASGPDRPVNLADQPEWLKRETFVRSWALGEVRERIPTCREILRDPRLVEWANVICGPDHKRSPGAIMSTPERCGQAWHQDSRDAHPRHFTLNRIVFASEVPAERGRLVVVPASHTMGDLPRSGPWDDREGQVAIAPEAGSLVLMHSRCFHMVERNQTPSPRSQFNGRVMPAECPDDLTARPIFYSGPWNFRTGRAE